MKATRREILALAAIGALGAWPASAETRASPTRRSAGSNQADFDQVWELVRDRFYDPRLNGLDWQEQRVRFRPEAASARSPEDAAVVINAMLAKLGASHTHFYTRGGSSLLSARGYFRGRARASRPRTGLPQGRGLLSGNWRVHRGRQSGPHLRNRSHRGRARARGRRSARRRNRVGGRLVRSARSAPSAARLDRPSRSRSAAPPAPRRSRSAYRRPISTRTRCSCAALKRARGSSSRTRPASDTCMSGPMRATGFSPRSRT